ncbi:MAG TPA: alanine racemase [Gemmatimonadales bacterium]|nr:alanine racemase [Gemmatimonadales bacterium]
MRKRLTPDTARAWVDVDLEAMVRNARSFMAHTRAPMLAMVKADAYGLGAVAAARALAEVEPWGYGVATIDEARELYVNGIVRPILICTPLDPSMIEFVNAVAARPSIGDLSSLRAWLAQGTGPFHIEIDTGMGRAGLRWDDAAALAEARNLLADAVGWEGLFTSLHSAERDPAATAEQWKRLQGVIAALGRRPAMVHASGSAAGAYGSAYAGDLVRPGIHLYGGRVAGLDPVPVAALRARVVALRRLAAGATVGYDATWSAPNQTTVATLAVGYADGVHRQLSNGGAVELLGQRLRIVGRISMDLITIDVGDLPVAIGDVATIWGGLVSLEEQAALAGTISYELLTSLGPRLPRCYQRAE